MVVPLLRRIVLALLCFVVAAAATPAHATDDIVLGMSAAFTGPSRGLGIELYRGSKAYFDHINQTEGGVFGRKVVISALDDGYNPDPAIRNTIHFIEDDNVLMLFNYVGTPTVTRVLPLLRKYSVTGTLMVFPFTGAQALREPPYDDYVFNLRASYSQETSGLVDLLVRLGRKRVSVLYQADAYGRSGWDGLRRALRIHNLSLVSEATYRRGASFDDSMNRQVDIIAKGRPDAVVVVGSYQASAAFIRDARDAHMAAPIANLSFVGSENLLNRLLALNKATGRDYTEGLINTQVVPCYDDLNLPAVREYRDCMDSYAPAPPPMADPSYRPLRYSFTSFEGFLNAKTLVAALRAYGREPSAWDLRDMLLSLNHARIGIDTDVTFAPHRHQGLNKIYYTTVKNGRFTPILDFSRWVR